MSSEAPLRTAMNAVDAASGFTRASVSMVITNPRLDDNPIVYVNDAFERMTGYDRSSIIGRNCRFLQGEDTNDAHVEVLRDAVDSCQEAAVDLLNYRANGEAFVNRLIITPIQSDDGTCEYFFGIQKELSKAEQSQDKSSIDDQLMEIQHRVKNHLSMIIGMIRSQSRTSTAPEDFKSLARRIESLQLLYEEMSASAVGDNKDEINLSAYLTRVANAVAHIDGRPGIRCSIDIEPLNSRVDTATRLGLLLSEVMTNAFKHAFDGLESGVVDVRMIALSEGGLRLTVSDDGVGLPKKMDWPREGSLGARIVDGLVDGLDGTLNVGRGAAGTVVTIDVPVGGEDKKD